MEARALVPTVPGPLAQHRRHPRVRAADLLVKLRVGAGMLVVRVDDISVGGLFARAAHPLPWGAALELTLVRAGFEEVALLAVVVSDPRRTGLALRFEGVEGPALAALRRLLDAQQADAAAERASGMPLADGAGVVGDLRARVALLQAENDRLRHEVSAGHEAQRLAGRLQVELDRLRARVDGDVVVDCEALAVVQRDVEAAWVAVARVVDAVTRLR